MNLQENIKVNKKIMALIESKHSEPFPLWSTNPESRYYEHLLKDTRKVEKALEHGGLAPIVDEENKDDLPV